MTPLRFLGPSLLAVSLLCTASLPERGNSATPPAYHLTAPTRGERWATGSRHFLTWEGKPAQPRLDYSLDRGHTWQPIPLAPNAERVLWQVPDTGASRCRLRLSNAGAGSEERDLTLLPSQEVPDYAWTQVTPKAAFAPRDGAGALTFKDKLWFLGGWNPGDKTHFPRICNNEVWSSVDGADWTLEKPNTFLDRSFDPAQDWEGRHTAGYVVHRNRMWIVGGDSNQGHYQNDVWSSADGKKWTLENAGHPLPWANRALHHTVAFKDWIWVLAGQTMPAFAPSDEVFYRDLWRSRDGKKWEQVTPKEPFWSQRGMIGGSAVLNGRIWILGGGTYDTPRIPTRQFFHDVWSSADGVKWTQHTANAPWDPRQYHDVAVYDGKLWVMEGYAGRNRNDVWYSSDGSNWYEVPNTPWKPRHAASVYVHAGALWMIAGNNMESDVWKLKRTSAK